MESNLVSKNTKPLDIQGILILRSGLDGTQSNLDSIQWYRKYAVYLNLL